MWELTDLIQKLTLQTVVIIGVGLLRKFSEAWLKWNIYDVWQLFEVKEGKKNILALLVYSNLWGEINRISLSIW